VTLPLLPFATPIRYLVNERRGDYFVRVQTTPTNGVATFVWKGRYAIGRPYAEAEWRNAMDAEHAISELAKAYAIKLPLRDGTGIG
jgi:hypothetical protein